eukprot:Tamp_08865.p1 GENE.Tamp_08865~~Tamp_08865.p1  ORF type:complete len:713 (+),score=92.74 Tamp_08865:29-2140(+)
MAREARASRPHWRPARALLALCLVGLSVGAGTRQRGWREGAQGGASCRRADALVEEAVTVGSRGDVRAAWRLLESALEHCPQHPSALGNLGYLNAIMGDRALARQQLQEALLGDPGLMEPWVNLGNIIKDEKEALYALDGASEDKEVWKDTWRFYRTALRLSSRQVDVTANVAGLHAMQRDWEYAAHMATRSLDTEFTEEAFCALMKALDNICDWDHPHRDQAKLLGLLRGKVDEALANPARFSRHKLCYNAGTAALISDFPPDLVLGLARAEMAISDGNVSGTKHSHAHTLVAAPLPPDRRLRLAYVSGHFLNHPMMQMMQGMFREHDPRRVHVSCYATSPSDHSALRLSAEAACHEFHLVASWSDDQVAQIINRNGASIFIALYGFLDKSRNSIASLSPAPLQINHRWCSTTGSAHIDYHVTDRVTSPPEYRGFYSEALALMPHSYLVNDHRFSYQEGRKEAKFIAAMRDRESAVPAGGGGREGGTKVMASLNNLYKMDPAVFAAWMRLLREVPEATLMLLESKEGPRANARLNRRAHMKYNIDPKRILRAGPLPKEAHIARHGSYTVFLDTWKVASHSTAVDALWASVPVLVLPQEKMQARVSGALVYVLGMPELLSRTPEDYCQVTKRVLTLSPQRQSRLRSKLDRQVAESPLFDTVSWVRHVERMHRIMWDLHLAQSKEAHIVVADVSGVSGVLSAAA